ncbi:MAG: putative LPS assembly protein LptD [Bacteroidota bacterium]
MHYLGSVGGVVRCTFLTFFFVFSLTFSFSQEPQRNPRNLNIDSTRLGIIPNPADTSINGRDTLAVRLDTTNTAPQRKGDITTTINYSARDSINFSVDGNIVRLYGDAKIDYGDIKLQAEEIEIDYVLNVLRARGVPDSTGRDIGSPIFTQGQETYETKRMEYNFQTGHAKISGVVTKQGEGFLHGDYVFKNERDELFSLGNTYTTCNLRHPHFRIRAKRTKAIPNDKIVAGPFNLEINDVPTPLGFLFGMFPSQNTSSSGIIFPSYGEERLRGFFLRGGGYFFDISDYIKIALTADVYTRGGYGLNMASNYRKRYKYNGNFNFNFNQVRLTNNIEETDVRNDFRITWSHTPQTKGNSRFSASVNASTSSFNNNVNLNNINAQINTTLRSNVSYSKTFKGTPFSMGLNGTFTQNVRTREVDLLLPDLSINMQNVYPFRKQGGNSNNWLSKLAVRYTLNGTNRITNNLGRIGDATTDSIATFDFASLPRFLRESRNGLRHTIPVSTSFKVLNHFTLSPSINYTGRFYFEKLDWRYDAELGEAVADTINTFNHVYDYSISSSLNTRIYGTVNFKKGSLKAIRHTVNPSLSLSYRPDFGDPEQFDFFQEVQVNEDGRTEFRSRHQGFVYGGAPQGESGSIGFSINNTLEAKVLTKKDTTDKARKVPILNNFGFSTSYNIVADSFNLAPISWRANTSVFEQKLNINMSGSIDPYIYVLDSIITNETTGIQQVFQRRIDEFAWNNGRGIGQLTRATIALRTNLNPKARNSEETTRNRILNSNLPESDKDFLLNNPEAYVDFSIPWSLSINYSLNYSKTGFQESNITQAIRFNGDFSLSEKWKATFSSGYDFENKDFTQTNIGINRDLHCWQMSFDWVPFGRFTSFNFEIRVKSSLLQDLKLNRRRSFIDNSF